MKLSKRLETVASFVPKGSSVVDIGTDHGYVPIFLVQEQTAGHCVAMDVRTGPLERAKAHIREAGLEEKIDVRLSDGLTALSKGEADCAVIAGMGGELIIHILEEGRAFWDDLSSLVLSPQSDIHKVRRFLEKEAFFTELETMVEEEGKYYTIMRVRRNQIQGTDAIGQKEQYYRYGRYLIRHKNPVLLNYLVSEHALLTGVLKQMEGTDSLSASARRRELLQELSWNEEAQNEIRENH